jgi:hypothetical protein
MDHVRNQCWTIFNGTLEFHYSFHSEIQMVSHLVITSLKIGLIVFTKMRTKLLRMDFPNFFENRIDFMREPKPDSQVTIKILLV